MPRPLSELKGWLDYDRPDLPYLTQDERILYFEERVNMVLLRPLDHMLNKTNVVMGRDDSSALLIFTVAICSALEATGKFLEGGRGMNQERFHAFVKKYMNPDYENKTLASMAYWQILWKHFRNGISHGFSVCHGGLEGDSVGTYFTVKTIAGVQCLIINEYNLLEDVDQAIQAYIADLLRVVTIIDNGLIKIIDVRRQHRLLPEDRSVPLLAMGNGTVLLSGSAEALPTAGTCGQLGQPAPATLAPNQA